jgi:dTDP-4-dehydrorhamnose reductase
VPFRGGLERRPAISVDAGGGAGGSKVEYVEGCSNAAAVDLVRTLSPAFVVHLAAVTSIAAALSDPEGTEATNVTWTGDLAEAAKDVGAVFVYASTDMVYDGAINAADDGVAAARYNGSSEAQPLSRYGASKLAGENAALSRGSLDDGRAVVVRLPLMIGAPFRFDAVTSADGCDLIRNIKRIQSADPASTPIFKAFGDEFRTPIDYATAALGLRVVAVDRRMNDRSGAAPILVFGGLERASRAGVMRSLVQAVMPSAHDSLVEETRQAKFNETSPEPRPADLSMAHADLSNALFCNGASAKSVGAAWRFALAQTLAVAVAAGNDPTLTAEERACAGQHAAMLRSVCPA